MYNIKVNFNHHYPMAILNSLITESTRLGYTVSKNNSIPVNSIYVNDKPVGYVVYEDAFHFGDHHILNMNANDYKKIFKFHYSPNIIDYSNLPINPKYL